MLAGGSYYALLSFVTSEPRLDTARYAERGQISSLSIARDQSSVIADPGARYKV
jgi:hypothetical protein